MAEWLELLYSIDQRLRGVSAVMLSSVRTSRALQQQLWEICVCILSNRRTSKIALNTPVSDRPTALYYRTASDVSHMHTLMLQQKKICGQTA